MYNTIDAWYLLDIHKMAFPGKPNDDFKCVFHQVYPDMIASLGYLIEIYEQFETEELLAITGCIDSRERID